LSELFNHDQAAAELDMHPATLHRLRQRGLISFRKAGRWVRYTREDLAEYLENVKQKTDGRTLTRKMKGVRKG
jgi:DNA-binding transcriptional MerR regulator